MALEPVLLMILRASVVQEFPADDVMAPKPVVLEILQAWMALRQNVA